MIYNIGYVAQYLQTSGDNTVIIYCSTYETSLLAYTCAQIEFKIYELHS